MKRFRLSQTNLEVSRLAFGCDNLATWDKESLCKGDIVKATELINTACDLGINLFDHADIYAFGKAEAVFGRVLAQSPSLRSRIIVQSKCGQSLPDGSVNGPIFVDLSRGHITGAVEGSLKRLKTDHLDILLLHAVDPLVEPDQVAQAFEDLQTSGKVRYFGVSNYGADEIALLRKVVRQPLVVNQIRLGLANPQFIAEGMGLTLSLAKGELSRSQFNDAARTSTLSYCRLNEITVQAWSPLRGVVQASGPAAPKKAIEPLLSEFARKKDTTPAAIALAWLIMHPAGVVPIIGGSNPAHVIENCEADHIELSRAEWYQLFAAAA